MVARFVDDQFRLSRLSERAEYLSRLGKAIGAVDWQALAYGLMSSHIHLSLIAGHMPFEALARRCHPYFARWLNRQQNRRGPLFSERPDTFTVDILQAPKLLAYIHNNPVKAGLCFDAKGSRWTSHRAYAGLEAAPPWLNVDLGLKMCGLDSSVAGRKQFHRLVQETHADDWPISRRGLARHSKEARDALGSAVLLGYPHVKPDSEEIAYPIQADKTHPIRHKWAGALISIVDFVAGQLCISRESVQSRGRTRKRVKARRIVLLISQKGLGRGLSEVCRVLGITPPAGLKLIRTADASTKRYARKLVGRFLNQEKVKKLKACSPSSREDNNRLISATSGRK
jgi:hypothetical protein